MKLLRCRALLPMLALLPLQACATIMHSAESIEAQVVDADTNQPLEGVIVVAHWQLERKYAYPPGVVGNDPRGPLQLKVMETVTDGQGRFHFPAWGPLPTPPDSYLEGFDPRIIMFKPGYKYYVAANRGFTPINPNISSTRSSWVNGTTIKLTKFEGDLKAYAIEIERLGDKLDFSRETRHINCDWKQIPRMLVALDKQVQLLRKDKIYVGASTTDDLFFQDQCGSAREFLKEYLE